MIYSYICGLLHRSRREVAPRHHRGGAYIIHVYAEMYKVIYIYIYREREIDTSIDLSIYLSISMYIYIYMYRERDRYRYISARLGMCGALRLPVGDAYYHYLYYDYYYYYYD